MKRKQESFEVNVSAILRFKPEILCGSFFGELHDFASFILDDSHDQLNSFAKARRQKLISETIFLKRAAQIVNDLDIFSEVDGYLFLTRKLTQSQEDMVAHLWTNYDKDSVEVVKTIDCGFRGSSVDILGKHFHAMGDQRELFDPTINTYMHLLQGEEDSRCQLSASRERSYFVSSFFFEKIDLCVKKAEVFSHENNKWMLKIIKSGNVFELKRLFIPIHVTRNHWILIVVYFKKKIIQCFDSLSKDDISRMQFMKIIYNFLKSEASVQGYEFSGWELRETSNDCVPQQKNFKDCGFYVCIRFESHTIFFFR